jgi:hypothetical protein
VLVLPEISIIPGSLGGVQDILTGEANKTA